MDSEWDRRIFVANNGGMRVSPQNLASSSARPRVREYIMAIVKALSAKRSWNCVVMLAVLLCTVLAVGCGDDGKRYNEYTGGQATINFKFDYTNLPAGATVSTFSLLGKDYTSDVLHDNNYMFSEEDVDFSARPASYMKSGIVGDKKYYVTMHLYDENGDEIAEFESPIVISQIKTNATMDVEWKAVN